MRPVYYLSIFIPIALGLSLAGASAPLVFFTSALGVIPTAALMSDATEHLATRAGPGIGGLLNVTFGNAPELIIAFFALLAGLQEVVKASLVGSVLGNSLLVLGASMLVGGWNRDRQTFNRTAAHTQAGMLLMAAAALILPAVFQLIHGGGLPNVSEERHDYGSDLELISGGVAIILILSYVGGLWFSLKTHRDLFNVAHDEDADVDVDAAWTIKKSVILLAIAGAFVGLMSEILVGSIEEASKQVGLSQFFVGVFVVAIVGNAAEHYVAVVVAAKNKMDLAVNIAIGSSAQIALFVAPLLVLLSFLFGPAPMALVFNGYELAGLLAAVLVANFLASEGESTWFEGVQLLALYAVLGLVFFFA
ncbi:MAG: Ca2+:H+ antiporter [Thermoleophilaceae bacterium]|nr:Ca2+:H+ antiporter [Thermoleophilaceae bacterium]